MRNVIIVGAGQAGFSVAAKLRKENYTGTIKIFGDENEPPYQRPPLSKNFLLGKLGKERLYLRKENFYVDNDIDLLSGSPVSSINRKSSTVTSNHTEHDYDALVIATGSKPRVLPAAIGGDLPEVFTIRGINDIENLRNTLDDAAHLLIVGGGYIGLEAAAVATQLGLSVTLLEAAPRILGRVACEETANLFRDLHQSHNVSILEGVNLNAITKDTSTGKPQLQIDIDGRELFLADAVIAGIGASATAGLAHDCGLAIDTETGGILANRFGQTSDKAIWCAGDCAAFPLAGKNTRLESVQNAIDQAENVALNLLGKQIPYAPTPWFWSDQFDVKLQIAGFNRGYNKVVTRQGGKAGARSHWYFAEHNSGQTLLAVDALNDAMAYMTGRRLLESGQNLESLDLESLADPDFDLKTLLGPA